MHRYVTWVLFLLIGLVIVQSFFVLDRSAPHPASLSVLQQSASVPCPSGQQVPGTEFCTHGGDPPPVGYAIEHSVQPLANAELDPAPVICDGDGITGQRIQVLYVRTVDAPDHYAKYLPSIRTWAAEVDAVLAASARLTGGVRHLRFVMNAACQVEVAAVTIPTGKEETFGEMIDVLGELGYNRADRKYLLFVDAKVYCGTGTILYDSQPGQENINNTKSGYARIDSGCWGTKPLLHELIHTLGGVQHDAPHSTQGWHCTDEYDIMCYSDAPHHPPVSFLCADASNESRLDCNHDDYFHTNPPPQSYLATHWNVANSAFLLTSDEPSPAPDVTLLAPSGTLSLTTPTTITLLARAVDRDGRVQRVEFYQDNRLLATVITPTYSYTWTAVPTGIHTLYAKAYDNVGASHTSASIQITVTNADGLVNSARGRPATQASTHGEQVASRAVDGIAVTDVQGRSTAQTQWQPQPWWLVDLTTALPLEKVHIWGSTGCCGKKETELEVLIATTSLVTHSLASALQQPGVAHYHLAGTGAEPLTLVMKPGQMGRYVLVGATTTTTLTLTEVEVMTRPEDVPVGGQNEEEITAQLYFPLISRIR